MALGQLGVPKMAPAKTPDSLPPGAKVNVKTALKTMALLGVAYTAHAVTNVFHKEGGKVKAPVEDTRTPSKGLRPATQSPSQSKVGREEGGGKTAAKYSSASDAPKESHEISISNDLTRKLDAQRDYVLSKYDDPVYLARAKAEGLTLHDIEKRKERPRDIGIYYKNVKYLVTPDGGVADAYTHKDPSGRGNDSIVVALQSSSLERGDFVVPHELTHDEDMGEGGMSAYAKKLYRQSFIVTDEKILKTGHMNFVEPETGKIFLAEVTNMTPDKLLEHYNYLKDPLERSAFKVEFGLELEKLGVKKYSDPYTPEVHAKVIQLLKEGKFSGDTRQFLMVTYPGDLEKIMNTIAAGGIKTAADVAIESTA